MKINDRIGGLEEVTKELVQRITLPSGNHLKQLYITTAAIRVLPRPVGNATNVFENRVVLVIDN